MLHYFSNYKKAGSLNVNMVNLDEALTLLYFSDSWLSFEDFKPLRNSIDEFLMNVKRYGLNGKKLKVPSFDTQKLNLPVKLKNELYSSSSLNERRKVLTNLLLAESHDWKSVYPSEIVYYDQ